MSLETFERIKEFIVQQTGAKPETITYETRLRADIGLDGDDAAEFFEEFCKRFQVDMRNFDFQKYFGPEGFDPIGFLFLWLFKRRKIKLITITVNKLIEAAEKKVWEE